MKKLLIIACLALSFNMMAGNQEKLIGTWKVDMKKFKDSKQYKDSMNDPKLKPMIQFLESIYVNMEMIVEKNKITMKMAYKQLKHSKYTIVEDKGKTMKINAVSDDGVKRVSEVTFVDDKNIIIKSKNEGDQSEVYFTKLK